MENLEGRLMPVLAVRNVVMFPGTSIPLTVGRTKSVAAIESARASDGLIVVLTQKNDDPEAEPHADGLYQVGTLCRIEKVRGTASTGFQVLTRGLHRVRVKEIFDRSSYIEATTVDLPDDDAPDPKTIEAIIANLKSLAHEILKLIPGDTRNVAELIDAIEDPVLLTNLCAEYIDVPLHEKQALLEILSLKNRALKLLELMQAQKESLILQTEIRDKLSQKIGRTQREAILREQLRAIREELGEGDTGKDSDDYFEKIKSAEMPDEVRKVALEEAKRLSHLGPSSPETHVIRNYLDLLCAMPWSHSTHDRLDLEAARQSLDGDHYGLQKIKDRIIQHLAVMKLKKGERGSILLFVGPPGVGKTSLGQSIAHALDRKFVRVALGGVRDDAEVRGHRRTYIGAMPGRIVQSIKRAGVNNPVMLLDEIDKLGHGITGDPAGALLEVLDPEQNATFTDHYLDVPFDLSKVFFIATANTLDTIPAPLRDRMEVIELSGYTTAEKLHIAKRHLLPKLQEKTGIEPGRVRIPDETLMRILTHYTREAGVRDLERKIAEIYRHLTEKIVATPEGDTLVVNAVDLEDILGAERFMHEVAEASMQPGVATGLAWTAHGGEILFIESRRMPGSGKLILTGMLGDVMKESAQIALSLVRSNLATLVPGFEFDKNDIHIHVPQGATPKDGPSAGITILVTLASLFTGIRIPPKLAMTGEVTLRGSVMPVGGIKEKVLAAHRAGITEVMLPERNRKDLKEIPDDVRSQMQFHFASDVRQVLKNALGLEPEAFMTVAGSQDSGVPMTQ